jgi:general secretion pathway protein L
MADFCVVRLTAPGRVEWLAVDAGGRPVDNPGSGTLAEAVPASRGRRLVVIVPGGDVALAEPEIPLRSGRLLQAVPYALEDSLAGDVESLHFAVGRPLDGRVPTAAVERDRLAGWLAEFAAAGLAPDYLYSEAMLLPANPSHTVLVCEGPRLMARPPGQPGIVIEAEPLAASLRLVGLPPAAGARDQTHVLVYASAADYGAEQATFDALRESVATLNVQILTDGPLGLLAAGAVTQPPFSLLQGPYAPRADWGGQWSRWRLAAGLFGLFVMLHVASEVYSWVHLRAEEKRLDTEILAVARDAMPDLTNPARLPNLRAVAEGRVRAAAGAGRGGLLGTLGVVAQAIGEAPDTSVSTLNYHDGTTDLTLEAPDVGAFDHFRQSVTTRGLAAAMQSATQKESRYQGHVQVKGS